jgi:glyoxylase-like metal-dependent hydrolase (beta-lactamase superfamily II)
LTDTLSKNPTKKPVVEGVGAKKVYTDGTRTVEMHHMTPIPHTNGMLIAYLPKERIVFQGDFTLPAAGAQPNDHVKALAPILLDTLKLDFDRFIPVHAPNPDVPWTRADLAKAVGR